MPDALETVLRLVADGTLTAEEAAPVIAALQANRATPEAATSQAPGSESRAGNRPAGAGRRMRLHVREGGKPVVDLRVPLALAGLATDRVPGLSEANRARIREALDRGLVGPLLEIRDEDDEVVIVVE